MKDLAVEAMAKAIEVARSAVDAEMAAASAAKVATERRRAEEEAAARAGQENRAAIAELVASPDAQALLLCAERQYTDRDRMPVVELVGGVYLCTEGLVKAARTDRVPCSNANLAELPVAELRAAVQERLAEFAAVGSSKHVHGLGPSEAAARKRTIAAVATVGGIGVSAGLLALGVVAPLLGAGLLVGGFTAGFISTLCLGAGSE